MPWIMLPLGPVEKGQTRTFKSENYAEAMLQKVKRPEVKDFFGTIEIIVAAGWIRKENEITIGFSDKGGYISSVILTCGNTKLPTAKTTIFGKGVKT